MTGPSGQGPDPLRAGEHSPDDENVDVAIGSSKLPGRKTAENEPVKRKILGLPFVALLGVLVLLGVGGWLAFGPARISPGMTRAEVDAHLGPPNGRMLAVGGTPIKEEVLVWKDHGLVIEFDEDDCVRAVSRPPSLVGNLRSMFGF